MNNSLKFIFNQFNTAAVFVAYQELNSGHINNTYLIKTEQKPHYILQKINGTVFKNAKALIQNKVLVSKHLKKKHADLPSGKNHFLYFIASKSGDYYFKDSGKNYWNLSVFIDNSVTYEKTPNKNIAYQAGKATANFLALTADFNADDLTIILPNFHSVKKRYNQFLEALQNASEEKIAKAEQLIDFTKSHIQKMTVLDTAIANKQVPERVTHNDTKISNILFSKDNKSLCLIDTDTVMKGIIHFDYGDAIRTICNTANEDNPDEKAVQFQFDYFKQYSLGFSEKLNKQLTQKEIDLLPISIQIMPFIMGLRFLTDFLNNNVYYKTAHPLHNFDRAKNQYALLKKIQELFIPIKNYIQLVFHS